MNTYTEDEVRELMSKIALDFYKYGQAGAEIVDLNASVEIYLEGLKLEGDWW